MVLYSILFGDSSVSFHHAVGNVLVDSSLAMLADPQRFRGDDFQLLVLLGYLMR